MDNGSSKQLCSACLCPDSGGGRVWQGVQGPGLWGEAYQDGLPGAHGGRDACEAFPSTAGQDDDARAGTAVAKHLCEALFLVGPVLDDALEFVRDVCVDVVVPKVIFLQHRVVQILWQAALFHLF